jgi:hypothetical protein
VLTEGQAKALGGQLPPKMRADLQAVLARGDVIGFDIAAPEKFGFSDRGMRNFEDLYNLLKAAAKARGKPVVLRPHVGEGYIEAPKFSTKEGIPANKEGTPAHYDKARENLDTLLLKLMDMGYNSAKADSDGVIIRFGHATQTTPEQAKLMASMGIIAEVNLGSNAATGAVLPTEGRKVEDGSISVPKTPGVKPADIPTVFEDHAFLHLLYDQVPVVLNTDAQGVMHTTLGEEYATAAKIIEAFKDGKITMKIDGKDTHYSELPDDVKTRFDMQRLVDAAEAYRTRIKAGKVPQ